MLTPAVGEICRTCANYTVKMKQTRTIDRRYWQADSGDTYRIGDEQKACKLGGEAKTSRVRAVPWLYGGGVL